MEKKSTYHKILRKFYVVQDRFTMVSLWYGIAHNIPHLIYIYSAIKEFIININFILHLKKLKTS